MSRALRLLLTIGTILSGAVAQDERGLKQEPATAAETGVDAGRYRALLIGVQGYRPPWPALRTPHTDVARLEQVLREDYGFTTTVLGDAEATRAGILKSVRTLDDGAGEADSLLIYYAGHGQQRGSDYYWIPVDGDEDPETWVLADRVRKYVTEFRARHVLVISDSCFAGNMTRGALAAAPRDIQVALRKSSRELITSGGNEPVADAGIDPDMSAFAYWLHLKLSENRKPFLHTTELYGDLFENVSRNTQQSPEMAPIPGRHMGGQFVFVRQGATEAVTAAAHRDPGVPPGWRLPPGIEFVRESDGVARFRDTGPDRSEMVIVPRGTLRLDGREHAIATPFLIDADEVTVARFSKLLETERVADLPYWKQPGYDRDDQPVVGVTLEAAMTFARWAGKELPDEMQWLYAAAWDVRAQRLRTFPWGDDFAAGGVQATTTVPTAGSCPKDVSPWGVRGMGSGVQEWCRPAAGSPQDIGVVRGATQVGVRRRHRIDTKVTARTETATLHKRPDLGFRCIKPLVLGER